MSQTASAHRTRDHTQVHRCRSRACGKAFWAKASWNRVQVRCPHCGTIN